jgi:hypothetical protein
MQNVETKKWSVTYRKKQRGVGSPVRTTVGTGMRRFFMY